MVVGSSPTRTTKHLQTRKWNTSKLGSEKNKKYFTKYLANQKWLHIFVKETGVRKCDGGLTPTQKEKVLWNNKNIDSGFPHSTDVDNPEWNRNSAPFLPGPRKTTIKQLRLERDGYSFTINNIVLFPWERNRNAGQSIRKEKSLGEIPKGQYYEAITHPW